MSGDDVVLIDRKQASSTLALKQELDEHPELGRRGCGDCERGEQPRCECVE